MHSYLRCCEPQPESADCLQQNSPPMNKLATHLTSWTATGALLLSFGLLQAADERPAGLPDDAAGRVDASALPRAVEPAEALAPPIQGDGLPGSPPQDSPVENAAAAAAPQEEASSPEAGPVEGEAAGGGDHDSTASASEPDAASEPQDEASGLMQEEAVFFPGLAIDTLTGDGGMESAGVPLADAVTAAEEREAPRALKLLGGEVPPGTYRRLSWSATELFEGIPVSTPVLAVKGKLPGPALCLTAAVHGDELNGIEMVRRVMHDLDPQKLSGTVIGVPIVNLQGFRGGSRYLPDRRDLNRYFPGNPNGSAASRIAYSFFTEVIRHCDALIDLHTGSFERANLPQLRADLRNPDVVTLTHGFGATVILHSEPETGTLRYAASRIGIPAVTLEAGGPSELELKEVMHGVKGIETLLNTLGMVRKTRLLGDPEPVYYRSVWVRADRGGILLADVGLGSTVRRGDLLGTITDPMNNSSTNLYAPFSGRVIGMARNQVVMPGFAAFHVGIQTAEASAADSSDAEDTLLMHEGESTNDDYIDGMSE
jgi:predicted deacylase